MRRLLLSVVTAVAVAAIVTLVFRTVFPRVRPGAPPERPAGEAPIPPSAEAPTLAARPDREGDAGFEPSDESEPEVLGVVVRPDGTPVRGARVLSLAEVPAGAGLVRLRVDGTALETDARGRFRRPVDDGRPRWLQVSLPLEHEVVAVKADANSPVRVELPLPRTVVVRVLEQDGRPARDVRVTLSPAGLGREPPDVSAEGGDWAPWLVALLEARSSRTTDREGFARFVVSPRPQIAHARSSREELETTAPEDRGVVTLRLGASHALDGVVRTSEGVRAPASVVWWRLPAAPWQRTTVEADGGFRIGSLPEGTVELWAGTFEARPGPGSHTTSVPTSAAGVDLRLDEAGFLRIRVLGWSPGKFGWAELYEDERTWGKGPVPHATTVGANGEAWFQGVETEGRVGIEVVEAGKARLAWIHGDPTARMLEGRLVASAKVTLELDVTSPGKTARVTAGGIPVESSWRSSKDGADLLVLHPVPTGTWEFDVSCRCEDGVVRTGRVRAEAPGRARVTLAADEKPR